MRDRGWSDFLEAVDTCARAGNGFLAINRPQRGSPPPRGALDDQLEEEAPHGSCSSRPASLPRPGVLPAPDSHQQEARGNPAKKENGPSCACRLHQQSRSPPWLSRRAPSRRRPRQSGCAVAPRSWRPRRKRSARMIRSGRCWRWLLQMSPSRSMLLHPT